MSTTTQNAVLRELSPQQIRRNPENPRLFFRAEEMDALLASINLYGIQVPITVYEDDGGYVLIDGERRWRCADKLNLKRIPALIQPKPSALQNLLLMFNIHALREQWDYITIANKLPEVIDKYKSENGKDPTEQDLSEATGLTRGQIRRCRLLIDLPDHYRQMLLEEMALPKNQQMLSEDLFIEMERSLKTVTKRLPGIIDNIDSARNVLIEKFRAGTINNVTDFRKLAKIATSVDNLGIREGQAKSAIASIFSDNSVSIDDVYSEQFELKYDTRRIRLNLESIADFLDSVRSQSAQSEIEGDVLSTMRRVRDLINEILEDEHEF